MVKVRAFRDGAITVLTISVKAYVALSRATSLETLQVLNFDPTVYV